MAPPPPSIRKRATAWLARATAADAVFWREIVPALVALRLALYVMTFVFFRFTAGGPLGFFGSLELLWKRWDVEHYLNIAAHGYPTEGPDAKDLAFFPLYPALVALGTKLSGVDALWIGMLWSNLASIGALAFLFRLTRERFGDVAAERTVWYAALFPTAYFFQAAYTEGLFLLFVVGSFYYIEKEQWRTAGIYGALASATRLTGTLVAVAALIRYWQIRKKVSKDILWLGVFPLGFVAYLGINWYLWKDPLKFLEFQRTGWAHESATPWRGFEIVFEYLDNPARGLRDWWFRDVMELLAAILGYLAAGLTFWRIGAAYGAYVLLSVLAWTSNTWWMSGMRFCLVLFPLFMWLGTRAWPRGAHRALWAAGTVAMVTFTIAFIIGNWAF